MSGLEIFGTLAAVAQIASEAATMVDAILQIYRAARKAPTRIEQGCRHLQDLVDTAQEIQQNKCLHTSSAKAHLSSLMKQVLALQEMLTRILSNLQRPYFKRLWTACLWPSYEARMVEMLNQIEREKGALLLTIANTNAQLTYAVNERLEGLYNGSRNTENNEDKISPTRNLSSAGIPCTVDALHSQWHSGKQSETPARDSRSNTANPSSSEQLYDKEATSTNVNAEYSTSSNAHGTDNEGEKLKGVFATNSHHIYQRGEVRDQARQINGDIGSISTISSARNHYIDMMAAGTGWQLNGNLSIDGLLQLGTVFAI